MPAVSPRTNLPARAANLGDLLADQARRRPSDVAALDDQQTITFAELYRRSSLLAAHLRALSVGPDDRIGQFLEPSVDLMVATWGVLLSGGCYLPLAPDYPDERVRYMVEDSRTTVVLTQPSLQKRLAELAPPSTRIVTLAGRDPASVTAGWIPSQTATDAADPEGHHLAYVIYTSGSTGAPKGVMVEHRNVLAQLRSLAAAHGIGPGRTVLQKTPTSFDAAQWELLAPGCGATVVMGASGIYRDPARLTETVRRHRVTTLQCVPTLLRALLESGLLAECDSLTQVFSGGEVLPRELAREFLDQLPGRELVNLYGPTECTINTSAFVVDDRTASAGPDAVTIGRPFPGVSYRILDAEGTPVAPGEIGELYIGGSQVARGYLGRPDLTAQRFLPDASAPGRLFRTGDLASWNHDGTVQFVGRADNQVKLRGYRVELDEIRMRIEAHQWVRSAAVTVVDNSRTGFQNLVAFLELNPREAALMDQGSHGGHHQSKASRLQVHAQLAGLGSRDTAELSGRPAVELPPVDDRPHRAQAFARKSYRFYRGGQVEVAHILRAFRRVPSHTGRRDPGELDLAELGEILRYLEPHHSPTRLLPKYGYASPGALYATQLYLELRGIAGLRSGTYYHHAAQHRLVRLRDSPEPGGPSALLHFVGHRGAIEPVYRTNIREVLEIETGHMVGLLEEVLPGRGLAVEPGEFRSDAIAGLGCAADDLYLGSFRLAPHEDSRPAAIGADVDVYIQAHPDRVVGLQAGLYAYRGDRLVPVGADIVRRNEVIAINQEVYDRASIGVTVVATTDRDELAYINMGRALQRLSMSDSDLGFMSAGYSSRTELDLPAARRMERVLSDAGLRTGPSYFFVGGRVSAEQRRHEGMDEDVVHMRGPAEMVRDDLARQLPDYMIPNRVVVVDQLPQSVNGKIDTNALRSLAEANTSWADRPYRAARTSTERRLSRLWSRAMRHAARTGPTTDNGPDGEAVSIDADFFGSGGNSLIAVDLVNRINAEFGTSLPLQVLFEHPTIESIARRVFGRSDYATSRLVRLRDGGRQQPIFCWPGLGGYPMNLRVLATRLALDRPFFGVQAHGLNPGETPYRTVAGMAAADVELLRREQPAGPYTLWGYSFGARPAFETAYLLERAGEQVENLFLIAPGSPTVPDAGALEGAERPAAAPSFTDVHFRTILFSVFAGFVSGPAVDEMLRRVHHEEAFVEFVGARFPALEHALIRRVVEVVRRTYQYRYTFDELAGRQLEAPITIFKARGDDYSFLESAPGHTESRPTIVELTSDHYGILRDPDAGHLVDAIHRRVSDGQPTPRRTGMPHVSIKHHPIQLTPEQQSALVRDLTTVITRTFDCAEEVVSIALEPVDRELWNEQVYLPEIVNRRELLKKTPSY